MAGKEIGLFDVIRRTDGTVTETKMGFGDTTGFFCIVLKVCLNVHIRIITDDFYGVLIGTDRTVRAEAPEFAVDCIFRMNIDGDIRQG